MRLAASIMIAIAALFVATPSDAQTYDPHWPVCMKVYGGGMDGAGEWVDCSYTSMPQCQATASGRTAYCSENRNFSANAQLIDKSRPRHRSH